MPSGVAANPKPNIFAATFKDIYFFASSLFKLGIILLSKGFNILATKSINPESYKIIIMPYQKQEEKTSKNEKKRVKM